MILVTGATGTVGSRVLSLLLDRGAPVRAMTRNPATIPPAPGLEVVAGDFTDPGSLPKVAAGVETAFLLSSPGPTLPAHDRAMVDAAVSAGVRRLVKLSAIRTPEMEAFRGGILGAWHAEGERAVRDSGLAWTILRPSSFASNTLAWAAQVRSGRPVPDPTGGAAQGVVDPDDIAAVAVEVLVSAGHEGAAYTVTGPAAITVPEQVAALEEALGRHIGTVDLPPEAHREALLAAGMDPAFAEMALAGNEFVRAGGNTVVTGDVRRVLGRDPGTYAAWARQNAKAFR